MKTQLYIFYDQKNGVAFDVVLSLLDQLKLFGYKEFHFDTLSPHENSRLKLKNLLEKLKQENLSIKVILDANRRGDLSLAIEDLCVTFFEIELSFLAELINQQTPPADKSIFVHIHGNKEVYNEALNSISTTTFVKSPKRNHLSFKDIIFLDANTSQEEINKKFYSFVANFFILSKKQIQALNPQRISWASQPLRNQYYPVFEKYFESLKDNIETTTIFNDPQYQSHSSKSGWQLFATNHNNILLIVLTLTSKEKRDQLLPIIDADTNNQVYIQQQKSGNSFSIGLYFSKNLDISHLFSIATLNQSFDQTSLKNRR